MEAALVLVVGQDPGRSFPIRMGQRFIIGRAKDATIRLKDAAISRRHAALELTPEGLWVTDLGSANGTLVGERMLCKDDSVVMRHGETLEIGEHVLALKLAGVDHDLIDAQARAQALLGDELEILGEIGHGATGRVYAVRHQRLGRVLAAKVLHTAIAADPESRERFLREGQISYRIKSPYIVEVHDLQLRGGTAFLLMELVHGPSARDLIPVPIVQALHVGKQVALALVAAHAAGVIHRDIKPANILLSPQGTAKLSDFGIAKDLNDMSSVTSTGQGMGTLSYVAPEQAMEAKTVGPAADLYSLGASLYHLIGGEPPFPELATGMVLGRILTQAPPPLLAFAPHCPEPLAEYVHVLMAKEYLDRPRSAQEVHDRLEAIRLEFFGKVHPFATPWSEKEATDVRKGGGPAP